MSAGSSSPESEEMDSIRVVIRVRPLNSKEKASGTSTSWTVDDATNCITQLDDSGRIIPHKRHSFDYVYTPQQDTEYLYKTSVSSIVHSVMNGFNGTVFAYGQTSSGKTYTMTGIPPHTRGIVDYALDDIFNDIATTNGREFLLRVSYMEIYNENINDLLQPGSEHLNVCLHPKLGPYVKDLTTQGITNTADALAVLKMGMSHRQTGSTQMNAQSSRSHTIFRVYVESRKTQVTDGPNEPITCAALNIVDLAGSERAKKTDARGSRLAEGGFINKSLLTLGLVIKKLSDEQACSHIPYRDSKLTHILEPALGGNSKTVMICTITPASIHADESQSTIQFASRAKKIVCRLKKNEIVDDATQIRRLQRQVEKYKRLLSEVNENGSSNGSAVSVEGDRLRLEYEQKLANWSKFLLTSPSTTADQTPRISRTSSRLSGRKRRFSISQDVGNLNTPARKKLRKGLTRFGDIHSTPFKPPPRLMPEERTPADSLKRQKEELSELLNERELEVANLLSENKLLKFQLNSQPQNAATDCKETDEFSDELGKFLQEKSQLQDTIRRLEGAVQERNAAIDQRDMQIANLEQHNKHLEEQQQKQKHPAQAYSQRSQSLGLDNKRVSRSDGKRNRSLSLPTCFGSNVIPETALVSLQAEQRIDELNKKHQAEFQSWKEMYERLESDFGQFKVAAETEYDKQRHNFEETVGQLRQNVSEWEARSTQWNEEKLAMSNAIEELSQKEESVDDGTAALREEIETLTKTNAANQELLNEMESNCKEQTTLREEMEKKLADMHEEFSQQWNAKEEHVQQEKHSLTEQLRQMEQTNSELQARLGESAECINVAKLDRMSQAQLKDAVQSLKRAVRDANMKLTNSERKSDMQMKTHAKVQKKLTDTEEKLKKVKSDHSSCGNDKQSLERDNKRLERRLEGTEKEVKKLRAEKTNARDLSRQVSMSTKKLDQLQKKFDRLNGELQNAKGACSLKDKNLQQLEQQLAKLNAAHEKLQSSLETAQGNLREMTQSRDEFSRKFDDEQATSRRFEEELSKYYDKSEACVKEIAVLKQQNDEYLDTIASMQQQCSDLEMNNDNLKSDLETEKMNTADLQQQINDLRLSFNEERMQLQRSNEDLKGQISALKESAVETNRELQSDVKILAELSKENEKSQQQISELKTNIAKLTNDLQETQNELRQKGSSLQTTEHALRLSESRCESLKQSLSDAHSERSDLHGKEMNLVSELAETRAKYQATCTDRDRWQHQATTHETDIQQLRNDLSERDKQLNEERFTSRTTQDNLRNEMEELRKQAHEAKRQEEIVSRELSNSKHDADSERQQYQQLTQERSHHIESLEAELKEKIQLLGVHTEQLESKTRDLAAVSSDAENLREEIQRLKTELKEMTSSMLDLEDQMCQQKQEFQSSQQQTVDEVEGWKVRYGKLNEQRISLQTQTEQYEAHISDLNQKLDQRSQQMSHLREEVERYQQRVQELALGMSSSNLNASDSERIEVLEEEKKGLEEWRVKAKACITDLREHVAKFKEANTKWRKNYEVLEAKYEKLKGDMIVLAEKYEQVKPTHRKVARFTQICREYQEARETQRLNSYVSHFVQTDEMRLGKGPFKDTQSPSKVLDENRNVQNLR